MKSLTSLFCLMFVLFAFNANAQTSTTTSTATGSGYGTIPGGIVWPDGNAIYYDFATQKETNLTADLKGAMVKAPIAASINGEWLAWRQKYKFWVRPLLKEKPYAIQYDDKKNHKKSSPGLMKDFVWQSDAISRMSLSPDGTRFSFETLCQKPGWILVDHGKPVAAQAYQSGQKPRPSGPEWPGVAWLFPLYAYRSNEQCWGIFYLSTIYNQGGGGIYRPRFGNVIDHPSCLVFRASPQDLTAEIGPPGAGGQWTGEAGGSKLSDHLYDDCGLKKSAHFLAFSGPEMWKNGTKLVYFIYQIGNQWGPIEIRRLDSKVNKVYDSFDDTDRCAADRWNCSHNHWLNVARYRKGVGDSCFFFKLRRVVCQTRRLYYHLEWRKPLLRVVLRD